MIYYLLAGAVVLASAAAGFTGYSLGKDSATAELYSVQAQHQQEIDTANRAVAEALAQLEREQNEWDQRLQKELQSKTIYRDCRSGLMLCGCSTLGVYPQKQPGPSPLVVASCPERATLEDDTLGAWVSLAFSLAQQYDKCREAALGSE